jgi:hypothetical protein
MKHNLIKTDSYLLVFGKLSEIKEGDWYKTPLDIYSQFNGTEKLPVGTKRVVAHLPLNGAPYLDGVDVLPTNWRDSGEEESKTNFAEVFYRLLKNTYPTFEEWIEAIEYRKQSREKYKFTEEDMRKAIIMSSLSTVDFIPDRCDVIIQTIQQPKYPIAFECEVELVYYPANWPKEGEERPPYRPKTFINSEGRTEWVGKYIYE